jgi:hypothetical protein
LLGTMKIPLSSVLNILMGPKMWFSKTAPSCQKITIRTSLKARTPPRLNFPSNLSDKLVTISMDWAQLRRFYQKTETESSFRNIVFLNRNKMLF